MASRSEVLGYRALGGEEPLGLPGDLSSTLSRDAAEHRASVERSQNARGLFTRSMFAGDVKHWSVLHTQRRTRAIASAKVARSLGYQAAMRTGAR